ncbi:hypothetical protein [Terrilactibacillus laevilacticus]|uniref:hypothetical protein n=1 Tax=Terrilactibacillus laevilacticus TaxID=1380157 RepID=UPI001146862E|nr:hypothetical protein [Terrilactibacillus laevilacticus]
MGEILILFIFVFIFLVALWLTYLGVKGAYSIFKDTIGSEQKEIREEIESLKSRLEEIEKKINL